MTKYEKGAAFERKIATMLRRKGYFTTRSAGSHSIADLTAIKKGHRPLLIQCKAGTASVNLEDQNKLFMTAQEAGAIAVTACKEDFNPIVFTRIIGMALKIGDGLRVVREREF